MKARLLLLLAAWTLATGIAAHAGQTPSGPLRVGAAKVDITPTTMTAQFVGVLDRIYSRAIVIDNGVTSVALVSVDVLSLPDPMCDRLARRIAGEVGIPRTHVFIAGTGTHSVPMGRPGQLPVPGADIEPGFPIDDQIVASVRRARRDLRPARMGYGTGLSYVNVQRDRIDPGTRRWAEGPDYDGPSDKTVAVVSFESPGGEPIAVYYNYAVFNVITGTTDLVSGDLTGAASAYVEESLGGKAVALFSLGAHGDQNPVYFQQTFDLRDIRNKGYATRGKDISNAMPPPGGTGLDRGDPRVAMLLDQQKRMILSMGQMLGEEVLRVRRSSRRKLSSVQLYTAGKVVKCPGRERTNEGRAGFPGTYRDSDPREIRLGLLMIGDVAIGLTNGIPYNAIGIRLKAESPYKKTLLATRVNGISNAGYIPDDASYGHETFEVLSSGLKPGCAESAIVDGIIDMMPPIAY